MEDDLKLDSGLVRAVQKGDDAAFQQLMRRHVRPIWSFVRQYSKSEEDAEDIVQDTFFKAWRSIKRFDPDRSFRPWLYAIARNTALDHVKKRRTLSFSEMGNEDTDSQFADTLEDEEPLPSDMFERAELAAELETAMKDLHPDHRAVLMMRYKDNMTFVEIAEAMDKPMNTVKSWHRRALAKTKKLLPHRKP